MPCLRQLKTGQLLTMSMCFSFLRLTITTTMQMLLDSPMLPSLRNGTPEQGKNSGNSNLHDGRWDQAFHPKGRNKRTVWEIPLGKFREAHFAVYPERLVETCLLASTTYGDVVLDPFTGSGTTGVVALRNDRQFIGCELVKTYQQLAQRRIDAIACQLTLF